MKEDRSLHVRKIRRLFFFFYGARYSTHLVIALALGLVIRLVTAYFVYGPMAIDDFNHNVVPAFGMSRGIPIIIPAYRSPLFVWILSGFFSLGGAMGLNSQVSLIRFVYACLGIISLGVVYGTYLYVRRERASRFFVLLSLYLSAAYFLMGYGGTRAFGEMISMPFVVIGLALSEKARTENRRALLWAGLLMLGISVLFRFQNGIIFLTYGVYWGIFRGRRYLLDFSGIGVILLLLEAGVDLAAGRTPFSTLMNYFTTNQDVSSVYGRTGWFSYVFLFLGISLFPLSVSFSGSVRKLARRHGALLTVFLIFLVSHSIIPHQEERFMFPVILLFLILLAFLWTSSRRHFLVRNLYGYLFWGVNLVFVLIGMFNNSQTGEFEPIARLASGSGESVLLQYESSAEENLFAAYYFASGGVHLETLSNQDNLDQSIGKILERYPEARQFSLVTASQTVYDGWKKRDATLRKRYACGDWDESASFLDRILYSVNPAKNKRRRPSHQLICSLTLGYNDSSENR